MASSIEVVKRYYERGGTFVGLRVETTERLPLTVTCFVNVWADPAPGVAWEPLVPLPPRSLLRTGLLRWTFPYETLASRYRSNTTPQGVVRFALYGTGTCLAHSGWKLLYFPLCDASRPAPRQVSAPPSEDEREIETYYPAEALCWR